VSVAVLLNLSDGLILGLDKAVTAFDANGISKVSEDSDLPDGHRPAQT
jgi:hypothetical protein